MINVLKRGMRVRVARGEKFITEVEFKEHQKLSKEFRRMNIDNYWEIQTKVENDYIGDLISKRK